MGYLPHGFVIKFTAVKYDVFTIIQTIRVKEFTVTTQENRIRTIIMFGIPRIQCHPSRKRVILGYHIIYCLMYCRLYANLPGQDADILIKTPSIMKPFL